MEDFTNLQTKNKSYGGANGNKKSVIYNNELWMLKFPSNARLNNNVSYSNSTISEYIASYIFNMVGIKCQQTKLGYYISNNIKRICVICKDFEENGYRFSDFASLRNQVVDSKTEGHSTNLDDILQIFNEQDIVPHKEITTFFWETFIIDALLGNWDRHNGNWGYLYNIDTNDSVIAPVFDNGSSLFPQADEKIMKLILSNPDEIKSRVYDIPLSAIKVNNQKINYFDFLTTTDNKDCINAIRKIIPLVNLDQIFKFIDEIEILSDIQKQFYKTIIKERKERILDIAFKKNQN